MSSKRKCLITGITGSGGSYLAEYIVENHPNFEVHGISRWHSTSANKNLRDISKNVHVHECDLNDFSSILSVLKEVKPDYVFHLASHANVRASFDTPLAVLNNNIMGTANLLEAIRYSNINPKILICSTSEVYGQVDPKNVPIKENCPINPSSPYAVSKTAQDLLGYTYFKNRNMKIIRTRMFAYLNPKRDDLFSTSFARQIVRIEKGLQKELLHGNLDSTRTIIDVRDAMEAYWYAIEKGRPGEVYNIGGEKIIKVGEFLNILKNLASCNIPSRVDPNLLRPTDVTLQVPDTSKFRKETGWKPKYAFEESVKHLLDYCRREVK
jgi:GDP-4-dehydro-6-deoxy-D-mannose reductase